MQRLTVSEACYEMIFQQQKALVTRYDLWLKISYLYFFKSYKSKKLSIRKKVPTSSDLSRVINALENAGKISKDRDFLADIYRINEISDRSAEELCSDVDPFCYVSHFSALEKYGFTNRIPKKLYLTTPSRGVWKDMAANISESDFEELEDHYKQKVYSHLPMYRIPHKVRGREISIMRSKFWGEHQAIRTANARISSIGQTFLETLLEPSLCGEMRHVIEIWENEATKYLSEILKTIDSCENKLAKVRAGYILEERLNIKNDIINGWKKYSQRGGSQKLDPSRPYKPLWSEVWKISLNL